MTEIKKTLYRNWVYTHRGYTYARYVLSLVNTSSILYLAYFTEESGTIALLAMVAFGAFFIGLSNVMGRWDYKRGTFASNIEIQKRNNAYDPLIAETLQYMMQEVDTEKSRELAERLNYWTKGGPAK